MVGINGIASNPKKNAQTFSYTRAKARRLKAEMTNKMFIYTF